MKKSELRTGMIIENKRGELATIFIDSIYGDCLVFSNNNQSPLEGYDEETLEWSSGSLYRDTIGKDYCEKVDIVKIYQPCNAANFLSRDISEMKLIWDKNEIKKKAIYIISFEYSDVQEFGTINHQLGELGIKIGAKLFDIL